MSLHTDPAYPASCGFVLKLHRDGRPEDGVWHGRVEHIASGRYRDFHSCDELLSWLGRMSRRTGTQASPDVRNTDGRLVNPSPLVIGPSAGDLPVFE